jgi:hypothetical protein
MDARSTCGLPDEVYASDPSDAAVRRDLVAATVGDDHARGYPSAMIGRVSNLKLTSFSHGAG